MLPINQWLPDATGLISEMDGEEVKQGYRRPEGFRLGGRHWLIVSTPSCVITMLFLFSQAAALHKQFPLQYDVGGEITPVVH